MTIDMQRKLTRASIAFDKIENTIKNIDLGLDDLIKKKINHSSNNISTIRFIKKNISNQFYSEKIKTCKKYIKADYGINTSTINNNNISIFQNIIDPLFHTIEIDGKNFNLMGIEWKRSK
jgi:predicted transcriptional regulator